MLHFFNTKMFFVVVFFFTALSVNAQNFPDRSDAANRRKAAPGHCIITAKMMRVVPARKRSSKENCKNSPCLVKIRIIKVSVYGSAFPVKFHENQKLKIIFVYSAKAFDDGRIKLPGMKRGDIFEASVEAKQKMNSSETEFYVYRYKKNP